MRVEYFKINLSISKVRNLLCIKHIHNILDKPYFFMINKVMSKSQHRGVITMIKKDGDERYLKNWRPISLLCVDYKIISRLLAKRIQIVLPKLIDCNQYCSVPGKSIIHCNMLIRDIVYYVNKWNN